MQRRICSQADCDRRHYAKALCAMHWKRLTNGLPLDYHPPTPAERFWKWINAGENNCWVWGGALDHNGYAIFCSQTQRLGHRFSYELHRGTIPDGLQIDHLCFNRRCVNPDHLEAVTARVNVTRAKARSTHCPQGHPKIPENTGYTRRGTRYCSECARIRMRKYKAAKKAALWA